MGSATLNTRVELSAMGPGERRMGSGVAARVAKWPAYTASGPRPFRNVNAGAAGAPGQKNALKVSPHPSLVSVASGPVEWSGPDATVPVGEQKCRGGRAALGARDRLPADGATRAAARNVARGFRARSPVAPLGRGARVGEAAQIRA